ncbi:MAG TPA: class I SAM-dependent methyltransferase [Alphaproteobacteria bacterium]
MSDVIADVGEVIADARVERERDFHNALVIDNPRDKVLKYYAAVNHGSVDYHKMIERFSIGADVLEYGCAAGDISLTHARGARSITGIDISDAWIARANEAAEGTQARFLCMNAEQMDLPDNAFDLVFGCSIVHHLDIDRCYAEIRRVLRPGGTALFLEPLGHNPVINAYRDRTPEARTVDEHPLLRRDFVTARKYFSDIKLSFYGLSTLGAVVLRLPVSPFRALDRLLLSLPGLKWQAWFVLSRFTK